MIAGLSYLQFAVVKNSSALIDAQTCSRVFFVILPSVLATLGILLAPRSIVASLLTCLVAIPIIICNFCFTRECIDLIHTPPVGEGLIVWRNSPFSLTLVLLFIFYGYLPALLIVVVGVVAGLAHVNPDTERQAAIAKPAAAPVRVPGPLNLPHFSQYSH
jgi:hypothetical protein